MTSFILTSIYFALPAIVSNSIPPCIKNYFKFLDKPVDAGKIWKGARILGSHKTWRGFIIGTLIAIFITYIQQLLYRYDSFRDISYINYETESFLLVGFLLGFGALLGDSVKSFFKRRVGVKSGDKFFPWDQIDALIGAGILILFIKPITLEMWLFYLVFAIIVHPLTNLFGYKLGFKDVPW